MPFVRATMAYSLRSFWLNARSPFVALSLVMGMAASGCSDSAENSEDTSVDETENAEDSKEDASDAPSEKEDSGASETPSEEADASKDKDPSADPSQNPKESEDDTSKSPSEDELPEPKDEFSDDALKACVKAAAGSLDAKDLEKLEYLDCHAKGIANLEGMSQLRGLKHLTLFENKIEEIGPLGRLSNLETLALGNNNIASLDALKGLKKLKTLSAVVNQLKEIDALAELSALEELNLDANQIEDISPLSKLEKLSWVTLDHNKVSDKASLDALKTKVELVYADLQGQGSWFAEAQERLRPRPSEPVRGKLVLRKDAQGYDFDFVTEDGLRIETAKEWWGKLSVEGERLVLEQGKQRQVVGVLKAGKPELCAGAFAERCQFLLGIKMPNDGSSNPPSVSVNLELQDDAASQEGRFVVRDPMQKHESLLPYVFSAPNQYDAGSCAYMAATGSMEILLNQKDKISKLDYSSKNNLAEPFLMNVSAGRIPYFYTDSMYNFNYTKSALSDQFMPFSLSSKGSAQKNWNASLPSDWKSKAIPVPKVERTVLFYDPPRNSASKWNVGLLDQKMVDRIKRKLRETDAPVMVVYNHNGYWHVSIVVGYDDSLEHGECPMVKAGIKSLTKQGKDDLVNRINAHMKKLGGCSTKGSFLVRDSIYPGTAQDEPYTYGGAKSNGRYSRRIVKREYEWIWYLSNHVTSVYRAESGGDAPE